jgi:hypothetical protein
LRSLACATSYKYSGNQDPQARSGIKAALSTIRPPSVISGHTAGWVGVGGPGLGPHGTDEWVQVGYSGFTTGQKQIYYEVAQPGNPPDYHTVKSTLDPSEVHTLAVRETAPAVWQVYVDNKAVSGAINLPGSHGLFKPQAIGESWNDGAVTCNSYDYGFAHVAVANAPGGAWAPAHVFGYAWNDRQDQSVKKSDDSFEARSIASAKKAAVVDPNIPPLLGALASKFAGRPVSARCVSQGTPVQQQGSVMLVSLTVCQRLLGYAMAQPGGPTPDSPLGKMVARTALGYLRGVNDIYRAPPSDPDCTAVTNFAPTLTDLGATKEEAAQLRTALLADNKQIVPKLDLGPGCPFQLPGTTPSAPLTPPSPPTPPSTPTPTPTPPPTPPSPTVTGPSSQTIAFGALPNLTFGAPDFAITATSSSGLPVTFSATGSCTVSGSTVHVTGAGSCSVTASQPGDANWNPAPDVVQSFTIAMADQAITFAPIPDHAFGDPDFTIGPTASSGLPVSLAVGAGSQCTLSGTTVHITAAGSCSITASQAGNANYNAAPGVTRTFAIAKASQTISFGALPDVSFGAPDFTVSATSSSGLPVSFSATGSCTVSGSTVHITGAGSCSITASQAGNANVAAAPSVTQSFAIAKAPQTISFGALPDVSFGAPDFNIFATSSSGLPVSFSVAGSCTVSGPTVHITGAGSCSITASQAGNANVAAAPSVTRTFAIAKASQTIAFASIPDHTFGDPDFALAATASSGLPVSYTASGSCTVSGSTVHLTGAGTCSITASQAGNADFGAAPSVTRSFTVAAAASVAGTVVGAALMPANGGSAGFVLDNRTGSFAGQLTYVPPGGATIYNSTQITSLVIAPDGSSATFTGVFADGSTFSAHVEDHGDSGDVFDLTIDGVLRTGDGSLTAGQIVITVFTVFPGV